MVCRLKTYIAFLLPAFLFAAGVLQAQENSPAHRAIDSAMAISPAYMPVYSTQLPGTFFCPVTYRLTDTATFANANFNPLLSTRNIYQSLGINAQAHKSMVFDYRKEPGFTMIRLPYPLLFKEQSDLHFYDVETSYTKLAYTYGLESEHNFTATHTQKIGDCNLVVDMFAYGNNGYFIHQESNMLVLDGIFRYTSPKKVYGLSLSYILNHGKLSENGGLKNQYDFAAIGAGDTNIINKLNGFEVLFDRATSTINTHDVMFLQYASIRDKKDHYFGTFTHTFQFKRAKSVFYDYNLNNDFYQNQYYVNTDTTHDTLQYYNVINTLQWSNYEPYERVSDRNNFLRFAGGARLEFVNAHEPRLFSTSLALFARTRIRLFKFWDLHGSISYAFFGYNHLDAIANAAATFAINRKQRHYIGLEADFYRVAPDYFYTCYFGNNNHWENIWDKQNNLKLSAFYTIFDCKASFSYFMLGQYLYIDERFKPVLSDKTVNVVQLNLLAPLHFKYFSVEANVSLQHSTHAAIAVPLFAGKLKAAGRFRIFKNRMHIEVGGDLMYNTRYYADGYNPVIHHFYRQTDTKTGHFIYFDLNLTFKIERISFFIRGGNLLAGFVGYNYLTTPSYPMQGQNLQLGIVWKFYD